jgi:hypothetical protein
MNSWILLPQTDSEAAYYAALRRALSNEPLPEDWLAAFGRLEDDRTYTAVLATALLAHIVNPATDPLALQAKAGPQGYNARGLFTNVIFRLALDPQFGLPRVPLGSIGREPHNNQPFFGHPRVDDIETGRIGSGNRERFKFLRERLIAIRALTSAQATDALASFLRFRLQIPTEEQLDLQEGSIDVGQLRSLLPGFTVAGGEGGRRGEAIVAAALDLAYPNVHLNQKANDPSRHWPADVLALRERTTVRTRNAADVLLAAEVKERIVDTAEVHQFAANLHAKRVSRGLYVALNPDQPPLPLELIVDAWRSDAVLLNVTTAVDELVGWCLTLAQYPADKAITVFALQASQRLREKQAFRGAREWDQLIKTIGG